MVTKLLLCKKKMVLIDFLIEIYKTFRLLKKVGKKKK